MLRSLSHALPGWVAVLSMAAITAAAIPAQATTVRALSLQEKVETAPVVLHARVERVSVEWEIPEATIHTIVTLRVLESIKGDFAKDELVVMRRGGGQIGDMTVTAAGLSEYAPGEEIIIFLEPFGAYYVGIGIGIAKYEVKPAADQSWVHHSPKVTGVRFIDGSPPRIEPIKAMVPKPLHAFLKELRSHARSIPMLPQAIDKATDKVMLKPRPSVPR